MGDPRGEDRFFKVCSLFILLSFHPSVYGSKCSRVCCRLRCCRPCCCRSLTSIFALFALARAFPRKQHLYALAPILRATTPYMGSSTTTSCCRLHNVTVRCQTSTIVSADPIPRLVPHAPRSMDSAHRSMDATVLCRRPALNNGKVTPVQVRYLRPMQSCHRQQKAIRPNG